MAGNQHLNLSTIRNDSKLRSGLDWLDLKAKIPLFVGHPFMFGFVKCNSSLDPPLQLFLHFSLLEFRFLADKPVDLVVVVVILILGLIKMSYHATSLCNPWLFLHRLRCNPELNDFK